MKERQLTLLSDDQIIVLSKSFDLVLGQVRERSNGRRRYESKPKSESSVLIVGDEEQRPISEVGIAKWST